MRAIACLLLGVCCMGCGQDPAPISAAPTPALPLPPGYSLDPSLETGTVLGQVLGPEGAREGAIVWASGMSRGGPWPERFRRHPALSWPMPHEALIMPVGLESSMVSADGQTHTLAWAPLGRGGVAQTLVVTPQEAVTFPIAGGLLHLECQEHAEETAIVFGSIHPYAAVSDTEGRFLISQIPVGTVQLRVWDSELAPLGFEALVEVPLEAGQRRKVEVALAPPS